MKKLLTAILLFSTQLSLAASRSPAGGRSPASSAPNTSTMPSGGTWLTGEKTRGLTITSPASGNRSTSIGFAHFRSENESFRWEAALSVGKMDGQDSQLGFSIDFGYRDYRLASGNLKGFTQPGAVFGKANNGGGFENDVFVGFYYRFGAEYFFSPNLAIGAMAGVALNLSEGMDRIEFGTDSSAVFLTLYW